MDTSPRYPQPRERGAPPSATLTDRFAPPVTTGGYVTLGDADAEVLGFGGCVGRIKILVLDNDALVRFCRRGTGGGYVTRIPAGARYDEGVAAESVVARNATAGLNARVQVEGFFAWS